MHTLCRSSMLSVAGQAFLSCTLGLDMGALTSDAGRICGLSVVHRRQISSGKKVGIQHPHRRRFVAPTRPQLLDQLECAQMKRSGSNHADSDLAPETPPPAQKRQRRVQPEPRTDILQLSTDILRAEVIPKLGFRELSALGCCSSVLRDLTVQSFSRSTYPIPVSRLHRIKPRRWMSSESPDACRGRTASGAPYTSGSSMPRTPHPDASAGPRNWPVRGSCCSGARHSSAERSATPACVGCSCGRQLWLSDKRTYLHDSLHGHSPPIGHAGYNGAPLVDHCHCIADAVLLWERQLRPHAHDGSAGDITPVNS